MYHPIDPNSTYSRMLGKRYAPNLFAIQRKLHHSEPLFCCNIFLVTQHHTHVTSHQFYFAEHFISLVLLIYYLNRLLALRQANSDD